VDIWESYDSIEDFLEDYDPRDEWPEVLEYFDVQLEEVDFDADSDELTYDEIDFEEVVATDEWQPGEDYDIEFWEEIYDDYEYYENDYDQFEKFS
jgi:hypothetical protein